MASNMMGTTDKHCCVPQKVTKGTMLRSRVLDLVLSAISVMIVDGVTNGSLVFDAILIFLTISLIGSFTKKSSRKIELRSQSVAWSL
jgi:hypothetical protein